MTRPLFISPGVLSSGLGPIKDEALLLADQFPGNNQPVVVDQPRHA